MPLKDLTLGEEQMFYQEYYPTAQYVIHNILSPIGNSHDVEECVQDVLCEVMNHYDKYDSTRGGLKNYIRVIARSKALYMKKKMIKKQTLPLEQEIMVTYEDELVTKQLIKEILNELTVKERQLFTFKFIYQMSTEEIAKQLGKSRGTVDVSLTRLRKKIAKLLTQHQIEFEGV